MDKTIRWLRISYWLAAIADFVVAILCLIPSRMGVGQYVYPMGLMSAVAFSWGVLLLFADREAGGLLNYKPRGFNPVEADFALPDFKAVDTDTAEN